MIAQDTQRRHIAAMLQKVGVDVRHGDVTAKCFVDAPGSVAKAWGYSTRFVKITILTDSLQDVKEGATLTIGTTTFRVIERKALEAERVLILFTEASRDLTVMQGGEIVIPGE